MNLFIIHRRLSPRAFALSAIFLTLILCVYYSGITADARNNAISAALPTPQVNSAAIVYSENGNDRLAATSSNLFNVQNKFLNICPNVYPAPTDIDTLETFQKFEFQPAWMKNKEYWDKTFEDRWQTTVSNQALIKKFPLKVIIVPHSHNDPGWLKTYEQYFYYNSKNILNNMVKKLHEHPNMTFIWSEISFLNMWWEQAHPTKRKALKKFVDEGRLEITTGGWVMTDEATTHVYAMIDQLIEGHQWLASKLNYKPKSGWSIDPFGHGSTVPYLLANSGINGTIIQRIHYAWKQWLAQTRNGDFYWVPAWKTRSEAHFQKGAILTHNQPFDIYSIKHSCGPHPFICLHFDFRKVKGEYTEYSAKAVEIDSSNIDRKSKVLVGEYSRTGSLFPHNVVLMPLGDDFRYNHEAEWDQQYTNYKKIMDYVNSHKIEFDNTEIVFGTPKDYFDEIIKRYNKFPKLKGDFFVYSDIFTEGRPAYWSGYFTTRPFVKLLDRQLEHHLRNAEILYTIALNRARQHNLVSSLKVFDRKYEKLIKARRNLGLFQHHDAITGTSTLAVMKDYSQKLFESIQDTLSIQQDTIQSLLFNDLEPKGTAETSRNFVLSDLDFESNYKHPKKIPITLDSDKKQIVLFNSLAQTVDQVVVIKTQTVHLKILDSQRKPIQFQINPYWNISNIQNIQIIDNDYEVIFIARLPAFSLSTYYIQNSKNENYDYKKHLVTIYCDNCHRENGEEKLTSQQDTESMNIPTVTAKEFRDRKQTVFTVKNTQPGDIQLETHKLRLLIDGTTGFLKRVTQKDTQKSMHCSIVFSAYPSAQFHSGAYLFMPDPNSRDTEKDVLEQYKKQKTIVITSGPISSELSVMYGPFLIHTIRLYHKFDSLLSTGIHIENTVDFEKPPKNRETELFMRVVSEIQNGDPPEFYSDLNGFQMQKRVKIEQIGIEGNYFPITTMAYIEDNRMRLSLLTDHAQGAASWQPGQLEVMLERRSLYDDARGMGEGLVDNVRTITKYWLLLEETSTAERSKSVPIDSNVFKQGDIIRNFNMDIETDSNKFSRPSLKANTFSNMLIYPVNVFVIDDIQESVGHNQLMTIMAKFPCDVHLVNLRTVPDTTFSHFPSNQALMILHRQGYDCQIGQQPYFMDCATNSFTNSKHLFGDLVVNDIAKTSLTGLHHDSSVNNLTNFSIEPMDLVTLKITFKNEK